MFHHVRLRPCFRCAHLYEIPGAAPSKEQCTAWICSSRLGVCNAFPAQRLHAHAWQQNAYSERPRWLTWNGTWCIHARVWGAWCNRPNADPLSSQPCSSCHSLGNRACPAPWGVSRSDKPVLHQTSEACTRANRSTCLMTGTCNACIAHSSGQYLNMARCSSWEQLFHTWTS